MCLAGCLAAWLAWFVEVVFVVDVFALVGCALWFGGFVEVVFCEFVLLKSKFVL